MHEKNIIYFKLYQSIKYAALTKIFFQKLYKNARMLIFSYVFMYVQQIVQLFNIYDFQS